MSAVRRTALGYHIANLVRGRGKDPEGRVIELVRRDSGDERAAEILVRQLVEAATERHVETGALAAEPLRDITSPYARRVLAVWLIVAEHARNGIANSKILWHEHIARRVRASVSSVERALRDLEASGVLKQWQAPPGTPGVARQEKGEQRCYSTYLLRFLPRALVRAVRDFWTARRSPAPRPEGLPPRAPQEPARATSEATESPSVARAGPPELEARFRNLAPQH